MGKHWSLSEEDRKKKSEISKRLGLKPPSWKGKHHSEETKKKMSKNHPKYWLGKKQSKKHIAKRVKGRAGYKPTKETIEKMTKTHRKRFENYVYKTDESKLCRKRIEYRLWRESVFARDNWTCQKCNKKGGILHSHHIKNFAQYPELRFAIDNGITLCEKCHIEFHKIYGKKNNTSEQIIEFVITGQIKNV